MRKTMALPKALGKPLCVSVRLGFEATDFGHDTICDLLVDFLQTLLGSGAGFRAQRGEVDLVAKFDDDSTRARKAMRPAKRKVRTKDADRNHRRFGFDHRQTNA